MTDLDKLIEAVEASDDESVKDYNKYLARLARDLGLYFPSNDVAKAFHGSLDAAKALHNALLPGWDWCLTPDGASVYSPRDNSPTDGDLDSPARAWLLAILKAYRAQVQKPNTTP